MKNIVYCKKESPLCKIICVDGTNYQPYEGLFSFNKKLYCCTNVFISESHLINFRYFEGYELINGIWQVHLQNNIDLPASLEGLCRIDKILKSFTVISCL